MRDELDARARPGRAWHPSPRCRRLALLAAAVAAAALATPAGAGAGPAPQLYVSLGDSYAAGYQPTGVGAGRNTRNGFAYQLPGLAAARGYRLAARELRLRGGDDDLAARGEGLPAGAARARRPALRRADAARRRRGLPAREPPADRAGHRVHRRQRRHGAAPRRPTRSPASCRRCDGDGRNVTRRRGACAGPPGRGSGSSARPTRTCCSACTRAATRPRRAWPRSR